MVGHSLARRPWAEAAGSAFAVASALPTSMNSAQIAQLFDEVEKGISDLQFALTADASAFRNASGESLLIVAARVNNERVAKQLVVLDPDAIDETDNEGWSSLLNCSQYGHISILRTLLENGAAVDQPDLLGWSPLMWAVYKNHGEAVDYLLNYKAHVNLIDEEDGLTPLIVASGRGFAGIVEKLIDADCQINACDKFGSTALIWAARKGHLPVAQMLLNAGAEVDAVGMYSSTALMLAARGNFLPVVDLLLTRMPNVNVVDSNGLSALGMAAREGYADICESLLNSGAFVNQSDKYGNWILTSAVRSGNAMIVRMLLDKFADVNCQDSDKRTPLHLAIDKAFNDIAYILLEKKPNLELKNKDGETPLIRAAKCRHVHLCTYLISAGAKLAATDNMGDNALHIAVRARSRRLTQALLSNPSDSRLLYRPNKLGQTPYSIDVSNPQPILSLIHGPIDAEEKMDSVMGYDVYANVLADILCEPSLSLPLTVGLYAKWGSGKSALLSKLKEAMRCFSREWLEGVSLRLSFTAFAGIFLTTMMITLVLTTLSALSRNIHLYIGLWIAGIVFYCIIVLALSLLYYGDRKGWPGSMDLAMSVGRSFSRMRLIYNVLMLNPPLHSETDSASNPVSFLFADYHRLSSIGGEQALAKIVATLFEAAETHFGVLPVRLFCLMRSPYPGTHKSYRRFCGIPYIFPVGFCALLVFAQFGFITAFLFSDRALNAWALLSIVLGTSLAVMLAYPISAGLRYSWSNVPRRRVNAAARMTHKLRFEGLMQKMQAEVDLLADLIRSLDAFTRSHTRLVVVVDGLDNCEQERMVQTLDALELLFSARKHRPFITIIAVDPHVIVSALNHNMHSALSGTELTGHDYLKNIVNMPFYLHNSALRQLQSKLKQKRESMADWKERFRRQDTFHGSVLSLDGRQSRKKSQVPMNGVVVGTRNVTEGILGEDYFSNMNPRAMRRIVNALTLTGRLMRAFEIDFSWMSLGHWVSLLEQWPSRMCWLIDRALEVHNNSLMLAELYHQLKDHIPNDELIALDRNPDNFEGFLDSKGIPVAERLTVGHVKKFVPCSSNLDPYLRKLIREKSKGLVDIEASMGSTGMAISPSAALIFSEEKTWAGISIPLVQMKLDAIIAIIRKLQIPPNRVDMITEKFTSLNLCGLVLASCPLQELKDTLQLPLGDWTLIRLLVETLKAFGNTPPGLRVDNRKVLTLREEDEEEEIEEAAEAVMMSERERAPLLGSVAEERRRRSTIMANANDLSIDHKWLMENLSGMDLTETEGDVDNGMHYSHFSSTEGPIPVIDAGMMPVSVSAAPSVRFEDSTNDLEQDASDADSTQSRFDSKENLLDSQNDVSPAYSRQQSNSRSELMHGLHNNDTVQSGELVSLSTNSLVSSEDDDTHQQTVQRRGGDDDRDARAHLTSLFTRSNEL
ncbi:unnamed protein product [Caenorhabditis auriculariae]|uniref:KAP NTPase domain-containing protein n=1 Tax=Caenorhabditis auriculariae TaxID=2777116 RepID=A0A8S1HQV5_9PELO|nr:unnamed protein product [Caenorhabditis auriculariae]